MKATLPERTVDAWLSGYLIRRFPQIELWAPTQITRPDFDFSARGDGKLFILETKAAYQNNAGTGEHVVHIDVAQLRNYCRSAFLSHRTYYALPNPPYPAAEAFSGRPAEAVPEVARARTTGHSWPGSRPFQEWLWVISAVALWAYLFPTVPLPTQPSPGTIPQREKLVHCATLPHARWRPPIASPSRRPLGALPSRTLRSFLGHIDNCSERLHVFAEEVYALEDLRVDASRRATVAFIPKESLKGWL